MEQPSSQVPSAPSLPGAFKLSRQAWGLIFAAWTLLGLINCGQFLLFTVVANRPGAQLGDFIITLVNMWLWALFTPSIFWLAWRFPLERRVWLRHVLLHVLLSIGYALVSCSFDQLQMRLVISPPDWRFGFARYFASTLFLNVQDYFLTLVVGYGLRYYAQMQERRLRATELESQLWQTRLQALEMQLRPHFFFNALHSVASLIRSGQPTEAVRMIGGIGDLMRAVLRRDGGQEVPLSQELELVEQYLAIERIRFQDRLEVSVQVAPETLEALVPHFLLQPLVENAIRHGLDAVDGRGRVELSVTREAAQLVLKVRDTGVGPTDAQVAAGGRGVGLANTRARLRHLYSDRHRFELGPAEGGGALALVSIPFLPFPQDLAGPEGQGSESPRQVRP